MKLFSLILVIFHNSNYNYISKSLKIKINREWIGSGGPCGLQIRGR